MKPILALDFGSVTGWALLDGNVFSGTWDIRPRRGESPGMRYLHLKAHLNDVLKACPDLVLVAYEQAHHRGGAATEYASGCVATLQTWCAEHDIEHTAQHSATIKKFATGKGNAAKVDVMKAMRNRGFDPADDNEADALALLGLVAEAMGISRSRPAKSLPSITSSATAVA